MRLRTLFASHAIILQAISYVAAQDIYSFTGEVPLKTPAIAKETAIRSLVPFYLDFVSLPDHQNQAALTKYSTSDWKTTVTVYEENDQFDTFVDISWPVGQGPGANTLANGDAWSACAIALPNLFRTVGLSSPGNGTCFDVIHETCLNSLLSEALNIYAAALGNQPYPTEEALAKACRLTSDLHLVSQCFGESSDDVVPIEGYGASNPANGRPFLVGVDKFINDGSIKSKAQVKTMVTSRVWPVIIVEAQGNYVVQASLSCPSPRSPPNDPTELTPSIDGTCGGSLQYRCTNTKYFYGNCCGDEGTCGYSEEACNPIFGCQPKYGLCDEIVVVTAEQATSTSVLPQPTAAFHVKAFEHQRCDGKVYTTREVGKDDGVCINTGCQVGGIDTAGAGSCPDGQLQISYWQDAECRGEWYGYEYTSRDTCKPLWSQGWKFKSLYLKCTAKEDNCISKGTCTADREPAVGVCETKPQFEFTAKSYYHADCTGDIHNDVEISPGDGFCVNTDCQVGSFDIGKEGNCPDGHVLISYWEQPNCHGDWYGYGYSSRGVCRPLWSEGWKFKSVWMKCSNPEDDCVNQGTCKIDAEPSFHNC